MISENVVIMTCDELRERLEQEFRRGAESALGDRATLQKRAALTDRGTDVIYSSDGLGRIHVASAVEQDLGDCLTLRWLSEGECSPAAPGGNWRYAHFSPARARLVARTIDLRATLLEEQHGLDPIDPIPEKMRKGPIGI